jgi:flagellin
MQESTNILQRMRDLSVQAANGSNSGDDRASLQKEVDQLKSELTRIADTTTFGGQQLLDGSYTDQKFQVGANKGETISFSVASMKASDLGNVVDAIQLDPDNSGAYDKDNIGIADETVTFKTTDAAGIDRSTTIELKAGMGAKDVADAINDGAGSLGLSVSYDDSDGSLSFAVTNGTSAATASSSLTGVTGVFANTETSLDLSAGDSSASSGSNVGTINIATAAGAENALEIIDGALKMVDEQRADLGAIQNRFESTISNLTNISENVSAARSRIRDVDFAQETAKMSQNQILQQASTTILAQANQLPQAALSLLG